MSRLADALSAPARTDADDSGGEESERNEPPPFATVPDLMAELERVLRDEAVDQLLNAPQEGTTALLALIERLVATVEHAERRAARAEALSLRDPLTGLANRRGWEAALHMEEERHRRTRSPAVVAIIDLDGFKQVNDTLGHRAGDRLLQMTAMVLASESRAGDVLARLGGDEFGLLGYGTADAKDVARRLQEALERADILASVGVSGRPPGGRLEEACALADRAMYRMKRRRAASERIVQLPH